MWLFPVWMDSDLVKDGSTDLRLIQDAPEDLPTIMSYYDIEDADRWCDFIRAMLRLDPSERPSAKKLLQHEWLHS
jgi:serine/threonine protein kinase